MNEEEKKQLRYHAKEILRILEAPEAEEVSEKKTKAKITPKKDYNPQNTPSGISWSYQGDFVLFTVPFKYKDGFKVMIKEECTALAKWDKDLKVWKLHEDQVTNDLLERIQGTPSDWFEAHREEHIL